MSCCGLFIGYVFGSIQNDNLEWGLGIGSNKENPVGIQIAINGFYLFDDEHSKKLLKC